MSIGYRREQSNAELAWKVAVSGGRSVDEGYQYEDLIATEFLGKHGMRNAWIGTDGFAVLSWITTKE